MKNLRIVAVSLMAVLFGLTALSMWPDRRFAPPLPYRPALYAGWPTIEHCEPMPVGVPFPGDPRSPVLSTCEDVLNEHNGVLEFDADGDGHADHRLIGTMTGSIYLNEAFELGSGPPVRMDLELFGRVMRDRVNSCRP